MNLEQITSNVPASVIAVVLVVQLFLTYLKSKQTDHPKWAKEMIDLLKKQLEQCQCTSNKVDDLHRWHDVDHDGRKLWYSPQDLPKIAKKQNEKLDRIDSNLVNLRKDFENISRFRSSLR